MSAGADPIAVATPVTPARLREAIGHFATGVAVVTAIDSAGRGHGSTANAVTSVSLTPPLLLVCLRNESATGAAALQTGRFAINVLRHDQRDLAERFARKIESDTWHGVDHRPGSTTRAPLLAGALATLECAVHEVADGGDHRIVIGRVLTVEHPAEHVEPLLFYRGGFGTAPAPPVEDPARAHHRPLALPEVGLPSTFGDLRLVGVDHDTARHASVVALVGAPEGTVGSLAYVHLGCVLGDALGHLGCRRRTALHGAIEAIREDGRGVIVYHRDDGSLFGGCCLGDESPPVSAAALAALRRTVERLRVRRTRLLVDPGERVQLEPAHVGLDVASTIALNSDGPI